MAPTQPTKPALARRVLQARQRAGLTQWDLAVKAGLALGTVTRLEQGADAAAQETLVALSRALDVSVDWLLGVEEPKR